MVTDGKESRSSKHKRAKCEIFPKFFLGTSSGKFHTGNICIDEVILTYNGDMI